MKHAFLAVLLLSLGTLPLRADDSTELAALRERVAKLEREVSELRAQVVALQPKPAISKPIRKNLEIRIIAGDWGSGGTDDIGAVCRSAASELWKHFPNREGELITVKNDKRGPMVIYGLGESGERRVLINTKDTYWSQYAYQFAHEVCHIACNYRDGNHDNLWFEESLCETASLFALRQMAETWQEKPPYANWKGYAPSLAQYAQDRIDAVEKLEGKTLAAWFKDNEAALKKNATDRAKNQIVAVALLPLFEKHPANWQAVSHLNQYPAENALSFREYLRDWHARVGANEKPFVAEIAKLFELSLAD